jgi:hypothetical protein
MMIEYLVGVCRSRVERLHARSVKSEERAAFAADASEETLGAVRNDENAGSNAVEFSLGAQGWHSEDGSASGRRRCACSSENDEARGCRPMRKI